MSTLSGRREGAAAASPYFFALCLPTACAHYDHTTMAQPLLWLRGPCYSSGSPMCTKRFLCVPCRLRNPDPFIPSAVGRASCPYLIISGLVLLQLALPMLLTKDLMPPPRHLK